MAILKINDVEKITGLSKKAIRLYESSGLVTVARDENGYRNYSNINVDDLKAIKLLRTIGASISDIKLYMFGVITKDELIDKRKLEILKESGKNSEKYHICESILSNNSADDLINFDFDESNESEIKNYGTLIVGIDIGTTTVSASIYDIDNKEQIEAYSLAHNSSVDIEEFSEQDVSIILGKAKKLLFHILDTYKGVVSIGITGQMHGIVYLDNKFNPVSNLINWQDKRADKVLNNGKTTCQMIYDITKEHISTGYGIATHYYNMLNNIVPKNATSVCSIMDLFAIQICGIEKLVTHTSVAVSLGIFDVQKSEFMYDKLLSLGIERSFLPSVTDKSIIIGKCRDIPVSIPIGDNQASFLGSVDNNNDTILVNIGTGSQVSMVGEYQNTSGDIETRPFIEGKYLVCGSALCGGLAYQMLEEFFRSYTQSCKMSDVPQYKIMNQIAKDGYQKGERGLLVDTSFCGKRSNPHYRGSILDIDKDKFTPSNLILGVLRGMCAELYELYEQFSKKCTNVIASGGAIKKNEVLQLLIKDVFSMEVTGNTFKEEAATGAALFSALALGKIDYKNGFSDYIRKR